MLNKPQNSMKRTHKGKKGSTMYTDKPINCRDCGQEFIFTAGEQEFYAAKGFGNEPTRCKACRDSRKGAKPRRGDDSRPRRQTFPAVCDECGVTTEVPFQPSQDKPVYCKECFNRRRG
jgi:CxxC-x17-CxxC domain-containing protein